jgi:DedD protein
VQAQPGEGYVVRLGAISDANNAQHLLAKLKANKIAGYSEVLNTAQGQRVRVRAGPFPTEESARSARDRLRQLKLIPPPSEGKIVRQGE